MIVRNAKSTAIATCLLAGVLAGCSTQNPEWLSKPSGAYCASRLTNQCLQDFAESAYMEATQKLVSSRSADDSAAKAAPNVGEAQGEPAPGEGATPPEKPVADSAIQPEKPQHLAKDETSQQEQVAKASKVAPGDEGSLPILGFGAGAVGASLTGADGFIPSDQLKQAIASGALLNKPNPSASEILKALKDIPVDALKAKVLFSTISLYGASMSDGQADSLINELYRLDQVRYSDALLVKLPGLLKRGDLERAHALRKVLLGSDQGADRFSMLAYVASCYSMAGLKEDAIAIVQDALGQGSEMAPDDKKLIGMAIKVGDGAYPMMQEFYDYQSDEVRLQAYLTIALVSRQLGRNDLARHAVSDAVRFIQKAATHVDRVQALGKVLALTPGLMSGS